MVVGGASTQSRCQRPGRKVELDRCSGAYEYSTDGRKILSWPMGNYGPLLGFPSLLNPHTAEIVHKLQDAMGNGSAALGDYAPKVSEKLAELLVERYSPYMTSKDLGVRFGSNGTDATQAAVALARYITGRNTIISVGYHGGSSPVFNFPPQNGGSISQPVVNIAFSDYLEQRRIAHGDVAAIVVEVPSVEDELATANILAWMAADCKTWGAKLILDDVVTGFRLDNAGALGYYGVFSDAIRADFVCLGKALSTDGKVSALLGPREIMDSLRDKVFFSYTYNDHPLGLLDAYETLKEYDRLGSTLYDHIHTVGSALTIGLNETFTRHGFRARLFGHPSRSAIACDETSERLAKFLEKMVDERDVLLHRPQFISLAHTLREVDRTCEAADWVLRYGL